MIRKVFAVVCLALSTLALLHAAIAWQESNYTPVVPQASNVNAYGGYGGYGGGGGTTEAGSALTGMANAISAQGNYNLATSAAAVNMTQAQKQDIKNRQDSVNAYFEMREANRQYVAAERGPKPTPEQMARYAHDGVPKPVSSAQVDGVSGKVAWPELLQDESFKVQRAELEQLVKKQSSYGALPLADQNKARAATETMMGQMKKQIRTVPPQEYSRSKSFLQSLTYSMTKTQVN